MSLSCHVEFVVPFRTQLGLKDQGQHGLIQEHSLRLGDQLGFLPREAMSDAPTFWRWTWKPLVTEEEGERSSVLPGRLPELLPLVLWVEGRD